MTFTGDGWEEYAPIHEGLTKKIVWFILLRTEIVQ